MRPVARRWMALALLTAFAVGSAPSAQAEAGTTAPSQCQPVWIDSDGNVHVDPDCLPNLDDVVYLAGSVVDLVWAVYCPLTTFIC